MGLSVREQPRYNITCYTSGMTGEELRSARTASQWTQAEAAHRLGVTQAYLSMVERGSRPVSNELASTVLRVLPFPAVARPLGNVVTPANELFFKEALGELGYPGFAYLHGGASLNPAELILLALDSEELDTRVTEALPWLPLRFPDLPWAWLLRETKLRDRQNRLAYVTVIAKDAAQAESSTEVAAILNVQLTLLERSRLANEDTLCKASLSRAERSWLRQHRPSAAVHWNLLTDLKAEDLQHV